MAGEKISKLYHFEWLTHIDSLISKG